MELADCARVDAMLAARTAGALYDSAAIVSHLARCTPCRLLADGLDATPVPAPLFPVVAPGVYEVGEVLGYGGMGRIRVAIDRRIGRRVAIKELLFHTDELAARFVREARVTASLQHPNIVTVYDVGSWPDGTPFYAMRLVEGHSLFDRLRRAGSLRDRLELLPSVLAAADAAAFAHGKGIVHRDLTPANIMLGDHGETQVIDWGLAKELRVCTPRVAPEFQTGLTQQQLTAKGDVLGSPAYMPPEQAAGGGIDARADVYALGAILYHVLAGRAPYAARSTRAVLARVRREPPVPLERHTPTVPAALLAIVRTAMRREPAERYPTAGELAHALRQFANGAIAQAHRGTIGRWFGRCA